MSYEELLTELHNNLMLNKNQLSYTIIIGTLHGFGLTITQSQLYLILKYQILITCAKHEVVFI